MTQFFQSLGMSYEWAWFVATVAGVLLIAFPLMLAVAMIIYMDRKVWAAINLRRGPNVVGPFGLLQSFADGLKVFLQETIIPSAANKGIFILAPIVTFTVALAAWAVIPFDAGVVLADINVGLLYILAISSLSVYGIVMSGWASNSKYPFFSAMRAAAQMISYEVSIGFILVCVVLWAGTFNLSEIVEAQRGHGLGIVNGYVFNLLLFPMWVVFFISCLAETQRVPFDLTEAESELVAGYQTEYSSMSFALFWLGEYANILLMCTLNALLFFGGWLPPIDWEPLYAVPGIVWLFGKILFFFFLFSWVMATVPRYRYDQLMRLGWKVFLPMSLIFVVLISGWLMLTRYDEPRMMAVQAFEMQRPVERSLLVANRTCDIADRSGHTVRLTINGSPPYAVENRQAVQWEIVEPTQWSNRRVASIYRPGLGGESTHRWRTRDGYMQAEILWWDELPRDGRDSEITVTDPAGKIYSGECSNLQEGAKT